MTLKKISQFISVLVLSLTFGSQIARADFRNVDITASGSYSIEYSIGHISTAAAPGKLPGGWTIQPFSIQNPTPIVNSHDFAQIPANASTTSFSIPADGMQIQAELNISTSDISISQSAFASASRVRVELVDASTNSTLATMYELNTLTNLQWILGGRINMYYLVSSSLGGHTAYVRMVVEWVYEPNPVGTYSMNSTTGPDGYAMSLLGSQKAAANIAANSTMTMSASPNPTVGHTNILLENVTDGATLRVFNAAGQQVANLTDRLSAGAAVLVPFNSASLRSGTYYVVLQSENGILTQRLTVTH